MSIRRFFRDLFPTDIPQSAAPHKPSEPESPRLDEVTSKLEPWVLACAVGAMNGSIYGAVGARGLMDFDTWLSLVRRDDWKALTGVADSITERALRAFATANQHRHMNEVCRDEEIKRGLKPAPILGPGESMTVSFPTHREGKANA